MEDLSQPKEDIPHPEEGARGEEERHPSGRQEKTVLAAQQEEKTGHKKACILSASSLAAEKRDFLFLLFRRKGNVVREGLQGRGLPAILSNKSSQKKPRSCDRKKKESFLLGREDMETV